jgi:hypothetical protein
MVESVESFWCTASSTPSKISQVFQMPRNQTVTILQNCHCPAVINVINPNSPGLVRGQRRVVYLLVHGVPGHYALGYGISSPALHSQDAASFPSFEKSFQYTTLTSCIGQPSPSSDRNPPCMRCNKQFPNLSLSCGFPCVSVIY